MSTPTAYKATARWTGANAAAAPDVKNGYGYDVVVPRIPNDAPNYRREAAYKRANSTVNDGTWQWPLFVTDISIDTALAGTTGQGRVNRDFYAHNFVQPSFIVQGQALDQEDYGMLCEFMHYAQQNSIANDGALLQLWIKGGGLPAERHPASTLGVTYQGQTLPNQIMRGPHKPILCQGFVMNMPRQHQAGVVSPTYTFNFAVAYMFQGIYSDNPVQVQKQLDWIQLVQNNSAFLPVNQALLKENNKVLQWAKSNSANILSNSAGS